MFSIESGKIRDVYAGEWDLKMNMTEGARQESLLSQPVAAGPWS